MRKSIQSKSRWSIQIYFGESIPLIHSPRPFNEISLWAFHWLNPYPKSLVDTVETTTVNKNSFRAIWSINTWPTLYEDKIALDNNIQIFRAWTKRSKTRRGWIDLGPLQSDYPDSGSNAYCAMRLVRTLVTTLLSLRDKFIRFRTKCQDRLWKNSLAGMFAHLLSRLLLV